MQIPFLILCSLACFAPIAIAQETAALIIGGYWYYGIEDPIQNYVELFGCEGGVTDSVELSHYPWSNYLAGGVYLAEENRALVCGGYSCNASTCNTMNECRYWDPNYGVWSAAPSLAGRRFNYLMSNQINMDRPQDNKVPLVLGYGLETEIWNKELSNWVRHRDITDRNWYSLGCLVDFNDKIYSLRDSVVELNPLTWDITEIGTIPNPLIRSGRCAAANIDGKPGIMTRYGYWYDLTDKTWHAKAFPPVTAVSGVTNAMWTFRGKPSIFGHPRCNDTGTCWNTEVYSYTWETDSWDRLGSMIHPRTYQLVIEIPGSYCSNFVVTGPTTPPTPGPTTSPNAATGSTVLSLGAAAAALLAVVLCSLSSRY